jgi:hypothetical protein
LAVTDSLFVDLTLTSDTDWGAALSVTGISGQFTLTSSLFIGCHSDHMSSSGTTYGGAVYATAAFFFC